MIVVISIVIIIIIVCVGSSFIVLNDWLFVQGNHGCFGGRRKAIISLYRRIWTTMRLISMWFPFGGTASGGGGGSSKSGSGRFILGNIIIIIITIIITIIIFILDRTYRIIE